MPQFSTKHKEREKTFRFDSFHGGYNEERSAAFLNRNELSACKNMKYVKASSDDGQQRVVLKKRQGTIKINSSAVSGLVTACYYYRAQSQYILATASKLYYLDVNGSPSEIGSLYSIPTFTEFNEKLIVHDGDKTHRWDGSDYDEVHRTFIDELLATGDNTETEFTGTLTHPPVAELGRNQVNQAVSITYTDTTAKEITDDGLGRLIGNVGSTWVKNISNTASNGGLIRITSNAHGFTDGDEINIQGVLGTTEANSSLSNPTWTVMNDETNTFDLTGSTYSNAYVSGGTASKNTLIYSTGVYAFKCSGAPDNLTLVEADYEEYDEGEQSSAGFIRKSRLYMYGCPEHPSRLYWTGVNDETALDTSAGGGYVDIDEGDGTSITGALNFQASILIAKGNSLHRIDDYPDDDTFKVEKLTDDLGCIAFRTFLFEGSLVSFLSKEGWVAMHPSERYGDIQKGVSLSSAFKTTATKSGNSNAYSEYHQNEKQLWISLEGKGDVYVVNLDTGGQVSLYGFEFIHSCFKYVNGEMLIGGWDGNLYRLDDSNSTFLDNSVSYSDNTYMKTSFEDWDLAENWKHNKKVYVKLSGDSTVTANLKLYKDGSNTPFSTEALTMTDTWGEVFDYTGTEVYDLAGREIGQLNTENVIKKKFNYKTIMVEITDIVGDIGVEVLGIGFKTAIMGEK